LLKTPLKNGSAVIEGAKSGAVQAGTAIAEGAVAGGKVVAKNTVETYQKAENWAKTDATDYNKSELLNGAKAGWNVFAQTAASVWQAGTSTVGNAIDTLQDAQGSWYINQTLRKEENAKRALEDVSYKKMEAVFGDLARKLDKGKATEEDFKRAAEVYSKIDTKEEIAAREKLCEKNPAIKFAVESTMLFAMSASNGRE